jgi:hypothetical protein
VSHRLGSLDRGSFRLSGPARTTVIFLGQWGAGFGDLGNGGAVLRAIIAAGGIIIIIIFITGRYVTSCTKLRGCGTGSIILLARISKPAREERPATGPLQPSETALLLQIRSTHLVELVTELLNPGGARGARRHRRPGNFLSPILRCFFSPVPKINGCCMRRSCGVVLRAFIVVVVGIIISIITMSLELASSTQPHGCDTESIILLSRISKSPREDWLATVPLQPSETALLLQSRLIHLVEIVTELLNRGGARGARRLHRPGNFLSPILRCFSPIIRCEINGCCTRRRLLLLVLHGQPTRSASPVNPVELRRTMSEENGFHKIALY